MTDEQRMKSSDDLLLSYLQRLIKTNPITLMWVRENECTGAGYVLIDGPNGVIGQGYDIREALEAVRCKEREP